MTRALRMAAAAAVILPGLGGAQSPLTARGAGSFETYSFRPGAAGETVIIKSVSEFTVPLGGDVKIGRRGNVAVSTGFASVRLVSNDQQQLPDQTISGLLDTELRVSWDLVPGKLIAVANGVLPTGTRTVDPQQLAVLGAISSDLIGYAVPSLGSGGNVGGGLIGAVPLGRFSAGFGATYKRSLWYQPVSDRPSQLLPGAELRFRGGLEGNLARRTFLRAALMVAQTTPDRLGGSTLNGIGTRLIGYVSVNQALGKVSVTAYGFDVYRGSPQLEATAAGAAILPKGNLFGAGARADYPLGVRTTVSPRVEFRGSAAAGDTTGTGILQRLGSSVRFGVDARQQVRPGMAAVLQAGGAIGTVQQANASIPFGGFRVGLSFEFTP